MLSDGRLEGREQAEHRLTRREGVNPNQKARLALAGESDGAHPLGRAYTSRGDTIAYRADAPYDQDVG
jgi:hypothetical protein